MPRIPGFETRSRIGMNAPEVPSAPTSQMGSILAKIGGEVTQFGVELEKRRKLAADARDVANKTLDLEKDRLETSLQLQNARLEDGTLRPDVVGWKDEAKGQKYTYAEKMQEFWDESFTSYSKTMASPEAESQFLRTNRPKAQKSILTAEAETLTMEADAFRKAEAEVFRSTTNGVLINPATDIDTLLAVSEPVMDSHRQLWQDGLIDEITYLAEDRKRSREMTVATLDNFVRNKRPDDIISLIYAGNFPQGEEKSLKAAEKVWGELGEKKIRERFERDVAMGFKTPEEVDTYVENIRQRVKMDPAVVLKYRGDTTAEKLSGSLSRKQIEDYLRKAGNLKVENATSNRQELKESWDATVRLTAKNKLSASVPEDRERFTNDLYGRVQADLHLMDRPNVAAELTQDVFGGVLTRSEQSVADQLTEMDAAQAEEVLKAFNEDPLGEVAQVVMTELDSFREEAPDPEIREAIATVQSKIEKGMKGGLGASIYQEAIQGVGDRLVKIENEKRKNLMEDPGGMFDAIYAQKDPSLVRPGQRRINEMDRLFDRYSIGDHYRKYASEADIKDFKVRWNSATSHEAKVDELIGLRSRWGGIENWLKVQDQYVEGADLPETMNLAFMMPDRESMERLVGLSLPGQAESIKREFQQNNEGYDTKLLRQGVADNEIVQKFSEALQSGRNSSLEVVQPTQDIIEALTLHTMATYNADSGGFVFGEGADEKAINNSVKQILERNFNIVSDGESTIISPTMPAFAGPTTEGGRMEVPSMDEMETFLRDYSDPERLAQMTQPPENFQELAANFLALDPTDLDKTDELWQRTLEENTYWATLPDMTGVALRFRTKTNAQVSNDPKDPFSGLVPGKDGKPITFKWKDIAASTLTRGPDSFTIPGAQ